MNKMEGKEGQMEHFSLAFTEQKLSFDPSVEKTDSIDYSLFSCILTKMGFKSRLSRKKIIGNRETELL